MRVTNLDMTDPNQNCPEGLRLVTKTEPPLRTCGRMEGQAGCTSTTYSTYSMGWSIQKFVAESLHINIVHRMLSFHICITDLYLFTLVV